LYLISTWLIVQGRGNECHEVSVLVSLLVQYFRKPHADDYIDSITRESEDGGLPNMSTRSKDAYVRSRSIRVIAIMLFDKTIAN
jgi:hypothetical protein